MSGQPRYRRQWRFYETSGGARPVVDFLNGLTQDDKAEVVAAMADVAEDGLHVARHLRGDIYEVRAEGRDQAYRVLFAAEGRFGQVLLALEAFSKKTQRTPPPKITLAQARLRDWRERGDKLRSQRDREAPG